MGMKFGLKCTTAMFEYEYECVRVKVTSNYCYFAHLKQTSGTAI